MFILNKAMDSNHLSLRQGNGNPAKRKKKKKEYASNPLSVSSENPTIFSRISSSLSFFFQATTPNSETTKTHQKQTHEKRRRDKKFGSTPVILTSCPSAAAARSESGKERRHQMTAALRLQLSLFQTKKEITKAKRKIKERKKKTLWTTMSIKTETESPTKNTSSKMQIASLGIGLQL